MAGNGPAPKENRRRRHADVYADVQKVIPAASTTLRGPDLEVAYPPCAIWEPDLRELVGAWWSTWRSSSLADAFLDTDWSRLALLLPMVASYYARPHYTKLAEIRQNESLLGATVVDRLKARIKVERDAPTPAAAPGVTALDDYRARLGAG